MRLYKTQYEWSIDREQQPEVSSTTRKHQISCQIQLKSSKPNKSLSPNWWIDLYAVKIAKSLLVIYLW